MMARKSGIVPDPSLVEPVTASPPRNAHNRWANEYRGDNLRERMTSFRQVIGEELNADLILYFFPEMESRIGVRMEWVIARLDSLRRGRGCSQETYARLLPIFWRMPSFGWPVLVQAPPFNGLVVPIRHGGARLIRQLDGTDIPYPPKKKEAA